MKLDSSSAGRGPSMNDLRQAGGEQAPLRLLVGLGGGGGVGHRLAARGILG